MTTKIKYVEIPITQVNREKFALVPLRAYEEFVRANLLKRAHKRPRPGFVEQRPKVAAFLNEHRNTKSLQSLLAECRSRFGDEDTPTQSSAYRYLQRLRKQDALQHALDLNAKHIVDLAFKTVLDD